MGRYEVGTQGYCLTFSCAECAIRAARETAEPVYVRDTHKNTLIYDTYFAKGE